MKNKNNVKQLPMTRDMYLKMALKAVEEKRDVDALYNFSSAYERLEQDGSLEDIDVLENYSLFLEEHGYPYSSFDLLLKAYTESDFDRDVLFDIVNVTGDQGAKDAFAFYFNKYLNDPDHLLKEEDLPEGFTYDDLSEMLSSVLKEDLSAPSIKEASDYESTELLNMLYESIGEEDYPEKMAEIFNSLPKWQKEKTGEGFSYAFIESADMLASLGKLEKAISVCDRAEEIYAPHKTLALIKKLSIMGKDKEKYADTVKSIKESMEFSPDYAGVYLEYLLEDGDYERVESICRRETEKDFPAAVYLLYMGNAMLKTGRYEEAKKYYSRLIKTDPCGNTSRAMLDFAQMFIEGSVNEEIFSVEKNLCDCFARSVLDRCGEDINVLYNISGESCAVVMDYVCKRFSKPRSFLKALHSENKYFARFFINNVLTSGDYTLAAKHTALHFALMHYTSDRFDIHMGYYLHTVRTPSKFPRSKKMCADVIADLTFKAMGYYLMPYDTVAAAADDLYERLKRNNMSYSSYRHKEELHAILLRSLGRSDQTVFGLYGADREKVIKLTGLLYGD